jgi:hypothetical protein
VSSVDGEYNVDVRERAAGARLRARSESRRRSNVRTLATVRQPDLDYPLESSMTSQLARFGATLARVGAVCFSLAVGAFLVVRAQQGTPSAAVVPAEIPAAPSTSDVSPKSTAPEPQLVPTIDPSAPPFPADFLASSKNFLPSSKSRVFSDAPPLVFPPGFLNARADVPDPARAGESADIVPPGTSLPTTSANEKEPSTAPPVLRMQTPRRYLFSSKSSTTFAPPPVQSGDGGWSIVW